MRKITGGLALTALLAIAGCSASAPHLTAGQQHRRAARTDLARSAGSVQNVLNGQVLRLGYLDDLGSVPALAALELGTFHSGLGSVQVQPTGYLSDLDEANALEHGQLDAAYLDPVAAVQAWQASAPGSLKIVAGAVNGPSELVARAQITSPARLRGKRVEAPVDSSQAAALDGWLRQQHLTAHVRLDGSAVTSIGILRQFRKGIVAAAWEPAPLAQQLLAAGGHVLAALPASSPAGVLMVTQRFMTANPAAVRSLLLVQEQVCSLFTRHPEAARTAVARTLELATGAALTPAEQTTAFGQLTCTSRTSAAGLQPLDKAAAAAAIIRPTGSLSGLFDLGLAR